MESSKEIKLQQELLKYKEQCEELKAMLTRSNIEQTLKDRFEKVHQELELMLTSKNEEIRELDKNVAHLTFELLKSFQAEEDQRISNSAVIRELQNKITSLESSKMASDRVIRELEKQNLGALRTIEELNGKNFEALRTIEELKHLCESVNRDFEKNKKKWEVLKVKMLDTGNTTGRRTPFLRSTQRNEGGGRNDDDDDTPDQARDRGTKKTNSSSINLDKGTKNSKGPDPVEVADSLVKAKTRRSANLSDLFAKLDGKKIAESPSPPHTNTNAPRSKKSRFGNAVDNLPSKIPKTERVSPS